jgi:hypothetical protein
VSRLRRSAYMGFTDCLLAETKGEEKDGGAGGGEVK